MLDLEVRLKRGGTVKRAIKRNNALLNLKILCPMATGHLCGNVQ